MPEAARIAVEDFQLTIRCGIFGPSMFEKSSFDVITMWDFLEHVPHPMRVLHASRQLVRPGGVLFVCVPNHRSILYGVASLLAKLPLVDVRRQVNKLYHFSHVCLWTPRSLSLALAQAGFRLRDCGTESPDLKRYRLSPMVSAGLRAIDLASRATGLRSRLWMLARVGDK